MSFSAAVLEAIDQQDMVEANLQLEKALKKDAEPVLAELGEQLFEQGFLAESSQIFKQLRQQNPNEYGYTLYLAEIAIENEQLEEASLLLEEIPENHGTYLESLLISADLYMELALPEVSERKLKKAKQLAPSEPIIDFALGELYSATEQFHHSIPIYEHLLDQGYENIAEVNLFERLGDGLSFIGEYEEAVYYLEQALKDKRTDERLFRLAVLYLQLNEREKAIALLQELRALNPLFDQVYLPLASALLDEDQFEEGIQIINEGIKENPYAIDLYHLASDAYYRVHDLGRAEEYLRQGMGFEEDRELSIIKLSGLMLQDERYEEAIDTLNTLDNSVHPYVFWNLAQSYYGLEDYAKAADYYQKAEPSLAHEPDFLREYGLFLREEGQREKASHLLTHYLQHVPDDAEIAQLLSEND